MDSSSPVPADLAATHSPSDVSYSSGGSRASTRTTSPATSSHRSSPLLDLHHLTTTTIEQAGNPVLDPEPKMDRNAFQSINSRRDKLTADRGIDANTGNNAAQFQRQVQQPQISPGIPIGPQASRSLASSNWRAPNEGYNSLDSTANLQIGNTSRGPTSFPVTNHARMDYQNAGLISYPNIATFSDIQLDMNYAYCFDRGNGQYTQLIPVDLLPPLRSIPAYQQGCQGMIVLPQPRGPSPNGRSSNVEPVAMRTPPTTPTTPADIQVSVPLTLRQRAQLGMDTRTLPSDEAIRSAPHSTSVSVPATSPSTPLSHSYNPHDPAQTQPRQVPPSLHAPTNPPSSTRRQSRIDTIVASTPPTPTHTHGHHNSGNSFGSSQSSCQPAQQHHHHQYHHNHQQSQQPQRRPKIYCDKWVHEGVCAFTQQGCKYKHEMPFDKLTQHQLGLFHGLPAWWKKHQSEQARQKDAPSSVSSGAGNGLGLRVASANPTLRGERDVTDERPGNGFVGARGGLGPGVSSGAGTGNNNTTWRQREHGLSGNSSSDPGRMGKFGAANNSVGSQSGGPRGSSGLNSSVWNPHPFGPIAPPQRSGTQTPHPQTPTTPGHKLNTVSGTLPTNNPYASLEALEESQAEERGSGVHLG